MNGVVLRMDLLDHFLQSLVREMHRYPPDWVILVPWWRPANEYADATAGSLAHAPSPQEVLPLDLRRILSLDLPPPPPLNPAAKYKHALFQHLGSLSSFEFRQHRAFQNRRVAGCYAVGQEFVRDRHTLGGLGHLICSPPSPPLLRQRTRNAVWSLSTPVRGTRSPLHPRGGGCWCIRCIRIG